MALWPVLVHSIITLVNFSCLLSSLGLFNLFHLISQEYQLITYLLQDATLLPVPISMHIQVVQDIRTLQVSR